MRIRKRTSQTSYLLSLQCVECVVRRVRGTSNAPGVHVCTTVVWIVKGKTGKRMDTRRSARSSTSKLYLYINSK